MHRRHLPPSDLRPPACTVFLENEFESQLQMEAEMFADCASRADFREGVTAFNEKRKAKFTGK